MKKFALVIVVAILALSFFAAGAQARTNYSESLLTELWDNSDLVVEAVITKMENSGDKLLCRVEVMGAFKSKMSHYFVPLELYLYLPKDAANSSVVLLFLKNDPNEGLVKAIRGTGDEPFVYKPDDFNFIKARLPSEYAKTFSREEIIAAKNQSKTLGYTERVSALFIDIPDSFGGLYYDPEEKSLVVILTPKADETKLRRDIARVTENSPYVRVIVEERLSESALNDLAGEIMAKSRAFTPEQKAQLNIMMCGANTSTGRVEVWITNLDDDKAALFKEWVSASAFVEFKNSEHAELPHDDLPG